MSGEAILDRPRHNWIVNQVKTALGSVCMTRSDEYPFIFFESRRFGQVFDIYIFDPLDKENYGVRVFKALKGLRPHVLLRNPIVIESAPRGYPEGTYTLRYELLACNLRLKPLSDKSERCIAVTV